MESKSKVAIMAGGLIATAATALFLTGSKKGEDATPRMPIDSCILAIDQGTTSSRVLVIDHNLNVLDIASREHTQISTKPGWVEHDPEEIYQAVVTCLREVSIRNNLNTENV